MTAPQPYLTAYLEVMRETIIYAQSLALSNQETPSPQAVKQIADMMDALHVIPELLDEWERCDEPALRQNFLEAYDRKWADDGKKFSMMAVYNRHMRVGD